MIIAVDGPAASGKGTVSRRLAAHYGLSYLDTGRLYRAVGAAALAAGADLDDGAAMAALAAGLVPEAVDDPALTDEAVGAAASRVAALPRVRAALLAYQQDFAARPGGAILDGRDIATVVCPNAEVKLFITATPEARARRRAAQQRALGHTVDEAALARDLAARDRRDQERAAAPLRPAPDAILLDTTEMSIDAAVDAARRVIDAARAQAFSDQA